MKSNGTLETSACPGLAGPLQLVIFSPACGGARASQLRGAPQPSARGEDGRLRRLPPPLLGVSPGETAGFPHRFPAGVGQALTPGSGASATGEAAPPPFPAH